MFTLQRAARSWIPRLRLELRGFLHGAGRTSISPDTQLYLEHAVRESHGGSIRLGTRDEGGGSGEAVGDECEQERGREGGEKCEHKNMEHLRVPLTREGSARRHTASLGSQDLNTGPSDSRATYHHLDSPTIYFCSQATQPSNYRHNFLTST